MNKLIHSFKYAFEGILTGLKKEQNMKIHFIIMILVKANPNIKNEQSNNSRNNTKNKQNRMDNMYNIIWNSNISRNVQHSNRTNSRHSNARKK